MPSPAPDDVGTHDRHRAFGLVHQGVAHRTEHQAGELAATTGTDDDKLLNGPKLDGDAGHASQDDIDALFN